MIAAATVQRATSEILRSCILHDGIRTLPSAIDASSYSTPYTDIPSDDDPEAKQGIANCNVPLTRGEPSCPVNRVICLLCVILAAWNPYRITFGCGTGFDLQFFENAPFA
jgi:hypothetical protein